MGLTVKSVKALGDTLKEMKPIDESEREISKAEAVKLLAPEIRSLQGRGYSLEQVVEALGRGGVELSVGTLKSYLRRADSKRGKRNRAARPAKAGRADSSGSPSAAS